MSKVLTVYLRPTIEADTPNATQLRLYDCGNSGERYEQALSLLDKDENAIREFIESIENEYEHDEGDVDFEFFQLGPGSVPRGYKIDLCVRDEEKDKVVHSSTISFNQDFPAIFDHIEDVHFSEGVTFLKDKILEIISHEKSEKNPLKMTNSISKCATVFPLSEYFAINPDVTSENLFLGFVRHIDLDEVCFDIQLADNEKFDKKKLFIFEYRWWIPNIHPRHSYMTYNSTLLFLYDNTFYYGLLYGLPNGNESYGILKFKEDQKNHTFDCFSAGFGRPLAEGKKDFIIDNTEIAEKAYKGNLTLTTFTIPNGVKLIGTSAFEGCENLVTVDLQNSVNKIGFTAFKDCKNLSSILIPDSVTEISWSAFERCESLQSIIIPDSVLTIGSCAFEGCISLKSVVFPPTLKVIESNLCKGCTTLDSVIIPPQVTNIEHDAFTNCTSLSTVTIQGPVQKIEEHAFSGCKSLKTIVLPAGIKKINKTAFEGCISIERIKVPVKKVDYYKKRLPEQLHCFIVE